MRGAPDTGLDWAEGATGADLARLIQSLYRVEGLLIRLTDLDALLSAVIAESRSLVDAEASSLLLYDEKSDDLYFHVAQSEKGNADILRRSLRLKVGEGIAGRVAETRLTLYVADAQRDTRVHRGADALTKFETRSILAVPMAEGDRLVGVIEVLNKRYGGEFTDYDQRILELFGGLAAVAITRARLIDENLRAAQLAAVGEAVAGLSHHTKNVIQGLSASVELVDMGIKTDNASFIRQGWPVIMRSVARLQHVVEDMLTFSKPRQPRFESCDIAESIQEALDSMHAELSRRDIEITTDTGRVALRVQCDTAALHRALLNLLTNAADAVPAKAGRIHIEAEQQKSGALTVAVEDNGPGVPETDRRRIFDPFYSSKGSQGTGLGLAVTAKIMREHGGSVRVERGTLGGARFVLELPAPPKEI